MDRSVFSRRQLVTSNFPGAVPRLRAEMLDSSERLCVHPAPWGIDGLGVSEGIAGFALKQLEERALDAHFIQHARPRHTGNTMLGIDACGL